MQKTEKLKKRSRALRILSVLLACLLFCTGCGFGLWAEYPVSPEQIAQEQATQEAPVVELPLAEPEEYRPDIGGIPEQAEVVEEAVTGADETGTVEEAEQPAETEAEPEEPAQSDAPAIDKDGTYYSKEEVALYIHTYGSLPSNFITKKEAKKLGWEGGSVEKVAPGKAIGGDYFGNYEGLLPESEGREYTECDIDTLGKKSRGAKRIIFSNDGLIYYTDDHYESFTLLYTAEGPA